MDYAIQGSLLTFISKSSSDVVGNPKAKPGRLMRPTCEMDINSVPSSILHCPS